MAQDGSLVTSTGWKLIPPRLPHVPNKVSPPPLHTGCANAANSLRKLICGFHPRPLHSRQKRTQQLPLPRSQPMKHSSPENRRETAEVNLARGEAFRWKQSGQPRRKTSNSKALRSVPSQARVYRSGRSTGAYFRGSNCGQMGTLDRQDDAGRSSRIPPNVTFAFLRLARYKGHRVPSL